MGVAPDTETSSKTGNIRRHTEYRYRSLSVNHLRVPPTPVCPKLLNLGFPLQISSSFGLKMGRMLRSCVQSSLKLVNSVMGMVGIALIMYAVWLIRVWDREIGSSPFDEDDYSAPWFIYTTLGLGFVLCLLTCSGHIAANTVNGCCLYLYMAFVFMLIMLEAGVTADIFLNSRWEEDFPEDPSKSFDLFKNFIKSNFVICKWIGLSVVSVQGLSLLLAMVLKALGPYQYYDSDDEYDPERVPLLNNATQPPHYVVGDPVYAPHK